MVEADKKSSRSSSSSKSSKSNKSNKSGEAAEDAPPAEPFVIAKYVLNGGEQSWVPESPHSSF